MSLDDFTRPASRAGSTAGPITPVAPYRQLVQPVQIAPQNDRPYPTLLEAYSRTDPRGQTDPAIPTQQNMAQTSGDGNQRIHTANDDDEDDSVAYSRTRSRNRNVFVDDSDEDDAAYIHQAPAPPLADQLPVFPLAPTTAFPNSTTQSSKNPIYFVCLVRATWNPSEGSQIRLAKPQGFRVEGEGPMNYISRPILQGQDGYITDLKLFAANGSAYRCFCLGDGDRAGWVPEASLAIGQVCGAVKFQIPRFHGSDLGSARNRNDSVFDQTVKGIFTLMQKNTVTLSEVGVLPDAVDDVTREADNYSQILQNSMKPMHLL